MFEMVLQGLRGFGLLPLARFKGLGRPDWAA